MTDLKNISELDLIRQSNWLDLDGERREVSLALKFLPWGTDCIKAFYFFFFFFATREALYFVLGYNQLMNNVAIVSGE